jgi:hypothetical protein
VQRKLKFTPVQVLVMKFGSFRSRQRARAQAKAEVKEFFERAHDSARKLDKGTLEEKGRMPGMFKGVFTISPDFDEPLPLGEWDMSS